MELLQFITNRIFLSVLIAWLSAFLLKLALNSRQKGFSIKLIYATGGMPSSHSAFVTALSLAVGLSEGFASPLFIVALLLSVVFIHDAINIRRRTDLKLQEICKGVKIKLTDVTPLGHSIAEAASGMAIGIAASLAVFLL
ncbi:divergent PAP2 family protein [Candidatus Woesearchaeota archaeon]|nr:divergent PAP2 family protein [Candidatus Woesearchaeota archaeon]